MSIRNSLWDDSPICKPSFLHFHPQILKQDPQNEAEQAIPKACPLPQELIPPMYKLNPGPLSPWSAYINPQNDRYSSQRVAPSLFRDGFDRGEGIVDRLDYSAEEEQDLATPIRQRYDSSDDMEECDLHTTGKKSECRPARKKRPRQKGLRQLSQRVYNIIQELERATYKDVAARLVNELNKNKERDEREEQNIKRRVYDALNVLISLGVLVKEGRKIACSRGRLLRPIIDLRDEEMEGLEQRIAIGEAVLLEKQDKLKLTQQKYTFIESLLHRNRQHSERCKQIEFPFIGILLKEEALGRNCLTGDSLLIESSEPMHLFGDIDSIKWLTEDLQPGKRVNA